MLWTYIYTYLHVTFLALQNFWQMYYLKGMYHCPAALPFLVKVVMPLHLEGFRQLLGTLSPSRTDFQIPGLQDITPS